MTLQFATPSERSFELTSLLKDASSSTFTTSKVVGGRRTEDKDDVACVGKHRSLSSPVPSSLNLKTSSSTSNHAVIESVPNHNIGGGRRIQLTSTAQQLEQQQQQVSSTINSNSKRQGGRRNYNSRWTSTATPISTLLSPSFSSSSKSSSACSVGDTNKQMHSSESHHHQTNGHSLKTENEPASNTNKSQTNKESTKKSASLAVVGGGDGGGDQHHGDVGGNEVVALSNGTAAATGLVDGGGDGGGPGNSNGKLNGGGSDDGKDDTGSSSAGSSRRSSYRSHHNHQHHHNSNQQQQQNGGGSTGGNHSSSNGSGGGGQYSKRTQQYNGYGGGSSSSASGASGSHTQRRYNSNNGYGNYGYRNNFGNNRRQFQHHNNDYFGQHHHHNNHHNHGQQQYSNNQYDGYYGNRTANNRNYAINGSPGYGNHHRKTNGNQNNNNGYVPEFEDGLPCPPPKRSWMNSNGGDAYAPSYGSASAGNSLNRMDKGFYSVSPLAQQLSPDASPDGDPGTNSTPGGGGSFVITAHSMGTCYEYLYGGNVNVVAQCGAPNGGYHYAGYGAHPAYNYTYPSTPTDSGTSCQESPCSETTPTVGILETTTVTNDSIAGSEKNTSDWQDEALSDGNVSDDGGSVSTSVSTNKSACEDDDVPDLTTDTGIRYLPMITPEVSVLSKDVTPHKGTLYLRHSARYGFGIHHFYPGPEFYGDFDTEMYVKQFSRAGEVTEKPSKLSPGYSIDALSESIWAKFFSNQQSTETFKKKMELWRDVYKAVRFLNISQGYKPDARNFPNFGLQVVGSTMSGFGSNTSDVDMCLLIRSSEVDQRFEAVERLQALWQSLKNVPGIENQELIYAKVPILKFRDGCRRLEVDLNCNNFVGIRNTHLLYAYAQMDWRLKPLVLVVKLWAQHHKINDAKNMTISSYSLVLMVIHFLQYGLSEPVLPCLHQMYSEKFNNSVPILNVKIHEIMPHWESKNKMNLGELLTGYLEYFAKKFDFSKYAVSVRLGGLLQIKQAALNRSPKNDPHQWKHLCVEEPFDRTNTARSVYDRDVFEKILGIFAASWKRLEKTKDLSSIFDTFGPTEARNISPYAIKSR